MSAWGLPGCALGNTRYEDYRQPRNAFSATCCRRRRCCDRPILIVGSGGESTFERWIHDQVKHDWPDLWEIQSQTPELKNSLLLGRRDAPDMDRKQYVGAMRGTIGIGYPEIKAFTLTEVDKEADGFQVVGCARLQRGEWTATTIQYIHVKLVNGKALFGWSDSSAERCKV